MCCSCHNSANRWNAGCALLKLALVAWVGLATCCARNAAAQDEFAPRIFEQAPYDELALRDEDGTLLKVVPLRLPGRRFPENPSPNGKLSIYKLDDPTEEHEVEWRHIDIGRSRFFEQIVLDEARGLVADGSFDQAYDYFAFLFKEYPKAPGLSPAWHEYLFRDAARFQAESNHAETLTRLLELHAQDPAYPNLRSALGTAVDGRIGEYALDKNLGPARELAAALESRFPGHEVVSSWRKTWANDTAALVEVARRQVAAGELALAHQTVTRALAVFPELPGLAEFADEVYRMYPRVVVGVRSVWDGRPVERLIDWPGRRAQRLLHRGLTEFVAPGPEGGEYACPLGTLEFEDVGRTIVVRLVEGVRWSGDRGTLTAHDIARNLLRWADPEDSVSVPLWVDLCQSVEVPGSREVRVGLRWSHVRPDALLELPVTETQIPADQSNSTDVQSTSPAGATWGIGGYSAGEADSARTKFVSRKDYFGLRPGQPREIEEVVLPSGKEALAAMRKGEVQVVDRVNPWDVQAFRDLPDVNVEPYALPTLHCLIANVNHPLLSRTEFRRAILYGIDRELILNRHLLRNRSLPGCRVISGPFATGEGNDDPLRYAYNTQVAVLPYWPGSAVLLSNVALLAVSKSTNTELKQVPTLRLVHAPGEVASASCAAIAMHLDSVKIPIAVSELPAGTTIPEAGMFDLWYAEVTMQEPVIDARRLLGVDGLARAASSYVTQALYHLDEAPGWREARQRIQRLHWLASNDNVVMPLFQVTEHYAYHSSILGVRSRPTSLYQSIETWQVTTKPVGAAP